MIGGRPGFGHLWWRLQALLARIGAHRTGQAAAGCAFYATLAIFPAASMLISIFGLLFDPHSIEPQLALLAPLLPEDAFRLLHRLIAGLTARPRLQLGSAVAIGGAIALWSASAGTRAILIAVDLAYETTVPRGFLGFRLFSVVFTAVAILAAMLALALLVAMPAIVAFLGIDPGDASRLHAGSLAVLTLFLCVTLAWLYRFGPAHRPRLHRRILPGVAMAGLLWVVMTSLFTIYAERLAHFDATYGPLGAIATVMLWFWLSSYAVLVGAEVNALLEAEGG